VPDSNGSIAYCAGEHTYGESLPTPLATINLHALWDSGILDADLSERYLTEQEFALELDGRHLQMFDEWTGPEASIEQWALEAHKLTSDVT
jgi:hypothetical protein